MILHIPHSARTIPANLRDQFVLSDEELSKELLLMTDAYTDDLFASADATAVVFPVSRLLVDVERFPNDSMEPMAKIGMGRIYERTVHGRVLRRSLSEQERDVLISEYYDAHHELLQSAVERDLEKHGAALIVDCHSFPDMPLPYEAQPGLDRTDFCVGVDRYHTPPALIRLVRSSLENLGFSVGVNVPFAGSIVPMPFYENDRRVASVMIEVNRRLYMNETTGSKNGQFHSTRECIQALLESLNVYEKASPE